MRLSLVCAGLLSLVMGNSVALAAEWPQFRGPGGQGHADARNLPAKWSESDNVLWKTPVAGRGWSSPVYSGKTLWMTTAIEHKLSGADLEKAQKKLAGNPMAKQMSLVGSVVFRAVSVDLTTGKILKDVELLKVNEPDPVHTLNSYASPTPILDGNLLIAHFGELGTVGLDTDSGVVKWTTTLKSIHAVGAGSSPVIAGDIIVIPCDGTDQQYVVGLNKLTGKEVWKTKRPEMTGTNGDFHKAFASPLFVKAAGRDQVIVPGAQWVVSYDPKSGKELWRVRHGEGFSNVPCPVVSGNFVYVCTGYMQHNLIAIRLDGEGDVTGSHIAWRITKQVPAMSSPVVVGDLIYFVSDGGVATAADAKTGDIVWTKRIAGNYSASPLHADGKLYFGNREGQTTVIRPGREYDEVAVNTLDGQHMASPVVYDNTLVLRTNTHLYRIGVGK